jgi:hypothetical protein
LTNSVTARPGHAIEILQGESPKRLLQGAAIGAVAKQFDIASAHNKESRALAETATGTHNQDGRVQSIVPKSQGVPKYRIRNRFRNNDYF